MRVIGHVMKTCGIGNMFKYEKGWRVRVRVADPHPRGIKTKKN